jgi:RNA polymerase subunit RPABC4/transcription elongation factor Spt4
MFQSECPHCGEKTEMSEPIDWPISDGEIQEESETCTWCEKEFTAKWKARVEFEFQEAV